MCKSVIRDFSLDRTFFNMILLLSAEIYLDFHFKNKYTVKKNTTYLNLPWPGRMYHYRNVVKLAVVFLKMKI